jgi:hypothetical protein
MVKKSISKKSTKEWVPTPVQRMLIKSASELSPEYAEQVMEQMIEQTALTEAYPPNNFSPVLRRPVNKDGAPGAPYKDEMNVLINLRFYFKDSIKYNEFARQIEINGRPMEDSDIMTVVAFMQTDGLMPGIHKSVVF